VEELLVERGVDVEHAPVVRWVQRSLPLLADAAMFARRSPGDRWFVDQTYVKVSGVWRYVYRAIDQDGQPGCWFGTWSRTRPRRRLVPFPHLAQIQVPAVCRLWPLATGVRRLL
jgi:hypothetical protein